MLKQPKRIIVCEKSEERRRFVQEHYPDVLLSTPLITHRFPLSGIEEAYRIFENKLDGVIKVAII